MFGNFIWFPFDCKHSTSKIDKDFVIQDKPFHRFSVYLLFNSLLLQAVADITVRRHFDSILDPVCFIGTYHWKFHIRLLVFNHDSEHIFKVGSFGKTCTFELGFSCFWNQLYPFWSQSSASPSFSAGNDMRNCWAWKWPKASHYEVQQKDKGNWLRNSTNIRKDSRVVGWVQNDFLFPSFPRESYAFLNLMCWFWLNLFQRTRVSGI